ncbi:hypothetical protein [Spiroplasma endosymbiont of Othius punctulatus]|uniref:hypothetical protein n=1 Tax=Spiroplasma endosymbiont of Othius punctulatus TaxID=3066289 RepID=UPI0030D0D721
MLDSLQKLLEEISNYLLSKKYKKSQSGNDTYFVNKKETPSIVRIALDEFESDRKQLDEEISKLTKDKVAPSIIEILLTYKSDTPKTNVIRIDSYDKANKELSKHFKDFKIQKEVKQESEKFEGSAEELIKNLQNPSKSSDEKLRKVINSFENPPIYTKIFSGVFVLVPIIVFISAMFISTSNIMFTRYGNPEVNNLFFGAIDYKLVVVGNQWWRILTYGLAPEYQADGLKTILQLIIFGWITYLMVKYSSSMTGILKTAGSFLIAYIIAGFALSFIAQTSSISGQVLPLAIITGGVSAIVVNPTARTSGMFLTMFTKKRLVLPYLALIVYILFFSDDMSNILYILISFGLGFMASIVVNHDYKIKNDKFYITPLIILAVIVAIMLILVFVQKFNPAVNMNTISTLALQYKMGLISLDKVNDILQNNFKWEISINVIGDVITTSKL